MYKKNHLNIKIIKSLDYKNQENDYYSFITNQKNDIKNQIDSLNLLMRSMEYLENNNIKLNLTNFDEKLAQEYVKKIDELRYKEKESKEKGIKEAIKILEIKKAKENYISNLYQLLITLTKIKLTLNNRIQNYGNRFDYQINGKQAREFYYKNYPDPNDKEFMELYLNDTSKSLIKKLLESELFSFKEDLFKEFESYGYKINEDQGLYYIEKIIGLNYKKLTSLSTAEFFILNLLYI